MTSEPADESAAVVLATVDQVVTDLHPRHRPGTASLDSRLERDLGLDSLALAEVLVSLEDAFEVSLPSAVLSTAETPRDLLRALGDAHPRTTRQRVPAFEVANESVVAVPADSATILDVLDWHCAAHPDRVHIHLLGDTGSEEAVTYADLRHRGEAVAQGLIDADLSPGDAVALMLPTGCDYFGAFIGVLMAGGVPVPIYPPARPSQIEEHLRRHVRLLSNARAAALITVPEGLSAARLLRSAIETLGRVATVEELQSTGGDGPLPRPDPGAIALIQYTSGSTGQPKGVVLSHANVLANIRAMGKAAEVTSRDVFVSWLPLYHDMGLIGAWFGSLCLDMTAVIMSPLSFLARPARWLEAIDAYGGTMTAAPNFAYELCLGKVSDEEMKGLDLSSLRMALRTC